MHSFAGFIGVAGAEYSSESIILAFLVASLASLYAAAGWIVRMVIKSEVAKILTPINQRIEEDRERQRMLNERIRQALHDLGVEGFEPHNVYPEGD